MRKTLALAGLLFVAAPGAARAQEETLPDTPQFAERVEVARVLMDLRIVDDRGGPLVGLGKEDIRVSVDGKPAAVDSLRWISSDTPYVEGLTPEQAAATASRRPTRRAPRPRSPCWYGRSRRCRERNRSRSSAGASAA